MGLDFGYGSPGCGEEDNRPLIISKVHFLHFTIILFFVSLISTIVISLATGPIDDKHVSMTLCELPIECKYLYYRAATIQSGFVNNKGADQPAHSRRMISAFVFRFLERTI